MTKEEILMECLTREDLARWIIDNHPDAVDDVIKSTLIWLYARSREHWDAFAACSADHAELLKQIRDTDYLGSDARAYGAYDAKMDKARFLAKQCEEHSWRAVQIDKRRRELADKCARAEKEADA